jgi:AcrR family transcriptional regulator
MPATSMRNVDSTPGSTRPRRKRRILGLDDEQRQTQRRRLLLDAALELFGTRGYANTSIELLCQTAAIGTNSFYELYPNKQAVMVGLYDRISDQLRQALTDEHATHHNDPDPIRPLVSAFVHAAADDPRIARVAFIEAAGISPTVEDHRRRTRNAFIDGLQAIGTDIRQARLQTSDHQTRDRTGPSPRRNAVAIVGAITEMTLDWLLNHDPDPIDKLIDDIAHHCRRIMDAIVDETSSPGLGRRGAATTS